MSTANRGAIDYVKNYRVVADRASNGVFRVVNLRNGLINKNIFKSRSEALVYAKRLAAWHASNKTEAGLKRTALSNAIFVEKYHLNKQRNEV